MAFYDNFLRFCVMKGVSPSGAASAIGLSNAAASGWKNGKRPNNSTLYKLADYFGVSIDCFLSKGETESYPVDSEFYEIFLQLCNSIDKSPSAVVVELGMNKSAVTNWKQRRSAPRDVTLNKIANYFDVSVGYLLGKETVSESIAETISEQSIRHALLGSDATDEMWEELKDFAEFLRTKKRA